MPKSNDLSPTQQQLTQAKTVLASLCTKCQKAQAGIAPGTSQHSLLANRIQALELAIRLVDEKLQSF